MLTCARNVTTPFLPFGWGIAVLAQNMQTLNTMRNAASVMSKLTTSLLFLALESSK